MYPSTPFQNFLESKDACGPAREWVGSLSPEEAWATCQNGTWMTWLLDVCGVSHRKARAPALAEYEKTRAPARADYAKATAPAEADYAKAIRKLFPCPVVL